MPVALRTENRFSNVGPKKKVRPQLKRTHHSSGEVYSTGLCEIPSFEGTKIIAVGHRVEAAQLEGKDT